jgi:hypothetical protein
LYRPVSNIHQIQQISISNPDQASSLHDIVIIVDSRLFSDAFCEHRSLGDMIRMHQHGVDFLRHDSSSSAHASRSETADDVDTDSLLIRSQNIEQRRELGIDKTAVDLIRLQE